MFQYRQVLVRLRAGDTVREIARSRLMGRDKLGALRAVADQQGWLDVGAEVPDDEAIVAALGACRRARSTVSSVEPHREIVRRWLEAGVHPTATTRMNSQAVDMWTRRLQRRRTGRWTTRVRVAHRPAPRPHDHRLPPRSIQESPNP